MAMITDISYALQAIRLSALRHTDDPLSPRIISLDPSFALNPYIDASGLSDIDRWPEIKRALDSPPPDYPSSYESLRNARNERAGRERSQDGGGEEAVVGREGGLKYTQTIIGAGRSGGMGMRVTGRRAADGEVRGRNGVRANSSEALSPINGRPPVTSQQPRVVDDGFFSPSRRPRADSAPVPVLLVPPGAPSHLGSSMLASGHGLGGGSMLSGVTPMEQAMSMSETSGDAGDEPSESLDPRFGTVLSSTMGGSARRSDSERAGGAEERLGETMLDEGSDVEEDEMEQDGGLSEAARIARDESRRSSLLHPEEKLSFGQIPITRNAPPPQSGLTAALNKHVPHLVSTAQGHEAEDELTPLAQLNPFASLYTTVAAPAAVPSLSLELFFPHSDNPSVPIIAKVRKDASVEDVTGYGLFKYWEEGRQPGLSHEDSEERWTTVAWGLRIVEDDGEVDEDFPPLDRDSKISKFSYGQFGIVEATASQMKQNAAKAPLIVRRPSRILAQPSRAARIPKQLPVSSARPSFPHKASSASSIRSFSSGENMQVPSMPGADGGTFKNSVGLSSALGKQVILRIRVTASADVHFTTTISVPSDIYIADLTEILCKKKRLAPPYTDWVLCLADLTLAIPVDRTVASLEGKNDLALVKTQWAVEHGLRIGDRRGGDPSASIFKRQSEPNSAQRFGPGLADFAQTYKKYKVNRKIAIGRHERVLALDGDYIHIMPSESRAFFDSMKTTSFHISLVASVKLSGRSGGFKLNVWREAGQKRYEFEAENERQAIEIVGSIQGLMRGYLSERSSMLPPPRGGVRR